MPALTLPQVRDLFGLSMPAVPADFIDKIAAYSVYLDTWNGSALAVGAATVALVLGVVTTPIAEYVLELPAPFLTTIAVSLGGYVVTSLIMRSRHDGGRGIENSRAAGSMLDSASGRGYTAAP